MDFEHFIYNGQLLPEYCDSIGIHIQVVKHFYRKLRRTLKHEKKSNEELLTFILDNLDNLIKRMRYKLWYHNMPLMIWCQINTKYSYDSLVTIISIELEKDPRRTVDDILDEFFANEHRRSIRD